MSQNFTNVLLNAIPSAAALLDEEGDIVTVNRGWLETTQVSPYFGPEIADLNYFDVLASAAKSGSDFGLKMIMGLRSVIDREEQEFSILYSVYLNDSVNWYKMNIVHAEGDGTDWLIVKHEKWIDSYAMKDAYLVGDHNSVPLQLNSERWTLSKERLRSGLDLQIKHQNATTYESELEKSLYEKEILLQEVHHRVKNNLAVISGLIELQVMDCESEIANQKLKQVQNRILSIAQIHESIYQCGNLVNVELDTYLRKFAKHMTYFEEEEYDLKLTLVPVHVNLNLAVPFGLLINELMILLGQNANCNHNQVHFALRLSGDDIELDMSSDCLTFQDIDELREETRFNFKIIHVLLQQLHATFEFSNRNPKTLKISFKNTNVRGSSSQHF